MKNIILILFITILISGCGNSTLKINKKDELLIQNNLNELIVSSKVTKTETLNYKNISVIQNRLQDEYGRVLFYEDVKTASNYKFNFEEQNSVVNIFASMKKHEKVYTKDNLSFIQLVLANDKRINIMLQKNSTQGISFVYGFSNYEFIKLAKKIKADSEGELKRLRYQGYTFTAQDRPLTKWSSDVINTTSLIQPLLGLGK